MTRVTVWNEYRHERHDPQVAAHYPDGIHAVLAAALRARGGFDVRTATLDEPEHGLTAEVLADTDVLTWWGHGAHGEVADEVVARVHARVLDGMGLVVLHSGHYSKIFQRLMGTACGLKWRPDDRERLWVVDRTHPIVQGLDETIELDPEEMYGEPFEIPEPDELVLVSWFAGGEIFRSGCTWRRGRGKVFYFRPGDEAYPTYHHEQVQQVIANGVRWAAPTPGPQPRTGRVEPSEASRRPAGERS